MSIMNAITTVAASIDAQSVNIPKAEINDAQFSGLISLVFGIAAIVAVIFIVLGGMKYTMSQGNPGDLEKGKDMIVYSLVGLGIVIMGFVIFQVVTANLFA